MSAVNVGDGVLVISTVHSRLVMEFVAWVAMPVAVSSTFYPGLQVPVTFL